jgi:hypothetical protein
MLCMPSLCWPHMQAYCTHRRSTISHKPYLPEPHTFKAGRQVAPEAAYSCVSQVWHKQPQLYPVMGQQLRSCVTAM